MVYTTDLKSVALGIAGSSLAIGTTIKEDSMLLDDRIFQDYKEAVDTYLELGFKYTDTKQLVKNELEVSIRRIGSNIWRTSVHEYIIKLPR
jgi:hypothetical protein